MKYDFEKKKPFNIIGIQLKTCNKEGQAAREVPELWKRVIRENLIERIPGKANNNIIALYTDYEGDFEQPYTVVIGAEVKNSDEIPEGMVVKSIPAETYAIFPVAKQQDGVLDTWKQIWDSKIPRKYTHDFEIYTPSTKNLNSLDVEIYISVVDDE